MRITKRVRVVVTALAVAAGTLAASAGSGVAAPPPPGRLAAVEIVKVEANVGDFWELSASCTMGRVAIGGGAEAGFGNTPSGHDLNLISSSPMMEGGQATGWVVSAHHLWDNIPQTVTAYAICAAPPAGYQVLQGDPVPLPQKEVAKLTCPTGKVVLGGDGTVAQGDWAGLSKSYPASANGPAASLYASRPAKAGETGSQDGWWAQATDDQSDSNMDLYNMCAQTV
ncbi:hypothetical protein [Streptomyces sp. NPDC004266]|uniref:hypothetical protein n=1 Tax=Streptomyces sp. NPDC004266 TaxID=3364693 RepID=UPI00368B9B7B